jgi:hypothetical protein
MLARQRADDVAAGRVIREAAEAAEAAEAGSLPRA